MICYATIKFSYDPDGEHSFPLTVCITETETENLLGMDFCQDRVSGSQFHLPSNEVQHPPKTFFCCGSLHQNRNFPYVSRVLTVTLLYTLHVDATSAQCWKHSPGDPKFNFPPRSIFQPKKETVSTGLIFINIICSQFESTLPTLIENNKKIIRQRSLEDGCTIVWNPNHRNS